MRVRQPAKFARPVVDDRRHQMDDALRALLHAPFEEGEPRAHHLAAEALEVARPDEGVGDPRLVLQRHEDGVALARPLADEHHAGDLRPGAVGDRGEPGAGAHPLLGEEVAQEAHGMRLQRQAQRLVVGDHVLVATPSPAAPRRALRRARPNRRRRKAAAANRQAAAAPPTAPPGDRGRASGSRRRRRQASAPGAAGGRAATASRRCHSRHRASPRAPPPSPHGSRRPGGSPAARRAPRLPVPPACCPTG